jgi:predicted hydrolase (HD superfamily)
MLTVAEADGLVVEHLGATPRAAHTRFVAYLMRQLAGALGADADLWEIVGLCHDLDFFKTCDDRSQHGLLTIQWLSSRIPAEAQTAIAAHDHRTGVQCDSLLADALKIADVIAVIDARLGRQSLRSVDKNDPLAALRTRLADRPYLCEMLERLAKRHELPIMGIIDIAAASALPSR